MQAGFQTEAAALSTAEQLMAEEDQAASRAAAKKAKKQRQRAKKHQTVDKPAEQAARQATADTSRSEMVSLAPVTALASSAAVDPHSSLEAQLDTKASGVPGAVHADADTSDAALVTTHLAGCSVSGPADTAENGSAAEKAQDGSAAEQATAAFLQGLFCCPVTKVRYYTMCTLSQITFCACIRP